MNNAFKISAFFFSTLIVFSCTQPAATTASNEQEVNSVDTLQIKDETTDNVLDHYLALKDALVLSDAAKSQEMAKALASTIKASAGLEKAAQMTDSIANSTDLVKQRATFTNLSNELIGVFKKAELVKGSFYVQFCPMANEGNGGYWLAAEQEVRNPYYGDEMLNCGEVKETIK